MDAGNIRNFTESSPFRKYENLDFQFDIHGKKLKNVKQSRASNSSESFLQTSEHGSESDLPSVRASES